MTKKFDSASAGNTEPYPDILRVQSESDLHESPDVFAAPRRSRRREDASTVMAEWHGHRAVPEDPHNRFP